MPGEQQPKKKAANALTSRIGRRFVTLFAVCALLPLIVFATLSVNRVASQMNADLRRELHTAAKTSGMGVAAQFEQIASDLALAADLVQNWGAQGAWSDASVLRDQVGNRCEAMWLVDGADTQELFGGQSFPAVTVDATARAHLDAGKPVVRFYGETPELVMMRDVDPDDGVDKRVVAKVRRDWFWEPDNLRGSNCEFAAVGERGRLLFHTFRDPVRTHRVTTGLAQSSSGTIEWEVDGESHLARYWHVFLKPQYDFDMVVVQTRSRAEALAVGESFVNWFWLTAACTLLFVVLTSLVQMRRTLDPILTLRDATQRLGQGDLATRVRIDRVDEFGELGLAFNDMAHRLQENISKREQTERELVASRDEALAAAKAKAEFVTNVSHEFRTPMSEILGAAEILTQLESGDDEARQEFSGIALHGAQRLARLLDDVLKIGEQRDATKVSLDVTASVAAAVDSLPESVRSRVVTNAPTELPNVVADGGQLTEVWARLLDNAGKFSADDAPIEVRVFEVEGRVVVEVEDHGAGIAAEDLDAIFEPFAQVGRDQMTDKATGTGLGLTLAKATVEAHGGRINVRSKPGVGSTFVVSLPAEVTAPVLA